MRNRTIKDVFKVFLFGVIAIIAGSLAIAVIPLMIVFLMMDAVFMPNKRTEMVY